MAHGKLTPRQKMINMMYLVLTAMLALNVSAEILKAFELIDKSLVKSATNAKGKNDLVYAAFAKKMIEEKVKVEKWKIKSDTVALRTKEVLSFIDSLKSWVVKEADGPAGNPSKIVKKDETNVGGQILIETYGGKYNNQQGRQGFVLKDKLNSYRDLMVKMIMPEDTASYTGTVHSINSNLNTDNITSIDGAQIEWPKANFDQLPLAAVVTMLSKIQSDVRNTETDILAYLFGKISASDYKFNKLDAIVKASGGYVLVGGKYQSEIFIAAQDTTVEPEIFIGGQKLPVKEGRGQFVGNTGSVGPKVYTGEIRVKNPSGKIETYPFKGEYEVGASSLVVSPTKMNVFYIGVDNPVEVSVSGVPREKVVPTIEGFGATIKRGTEGYIVRATQMTPKGQFCYVGAIATIDGQQKNMGRMPFRIKRVPDPVAKVPTGDPLNEKGGPIAKGTLLGQSGIKADLENFDFDLTFQIIKFRVSVTIGGYVEDADAAGPRFSPQQIQLMKRVNTGQKVYIEDIIARGPDGVDRKLGALAFKYR